MCSGPLHYFAPGRAAEHAPMYLRLRGEYPLCPGTLPEVVRPKGFRSEPRSSGRFAVTATASSVMGPLRCPAVGIKLLYLVEEPEESVIGHAGADPRSRTGAHMEVHP